MAKYNLQALKPEYEKLFDDCVIKPEFQAQVDAVLSKINKGKTRYYLVHQVTGVPWYFIGIIHSLECGCDFSKHLHNGDPITAKTTRVPSGRPPNWAYGMKWEDSAVDALQLKAMQKWSDWSIPGMLYMLERYNGWGYRPKGINSPYLWSGSNQYDKGKYVKDGVFDKDAVSKQVGVALLLKRMKEKGVF